MLVKNVEDLFGSLCEWDVDVFHAHFGCVLQVGAQVVNHFKVEVKKAGTFDDG